MQTLSAVTPKCAVMFKWQYSKRGLLYITERPSTVEVLADRKEYCAPMVTLRLGT